jgi:hypothetical protein
MRKRAKSLWLFRVALRSQPIDAPGALHPFVDFGLAGQALDVTNFDAGTVGLDLPVAFRDAFRLEDDSDSRSFGHGAKYVPSGRSGND